MVHGKRHRLAFVAGGAVSEFPHHRGQTQFLIEIGTGQVDAVVGQNIAGPVGLAGQRGAEPNQGKIGGAAADIDHQGQFFPFQAGFKIERGGDRLELKPHLVETDFQGNLGQGRFSQAVSYFVVIDKVNRPAEDQVRQPARGMRLGHFLQMRQELADDLTVGHRLAADKGGLPQKLAAQQTLQRAHQAAFAAFLVFRQRLPAKGRGALLRVVKDRGRNRIPAVLQGHQEGLPFIDQANGGIGGSEIDGCDTTVQIRHANNPVS